MTAPHMSVIYDCIALLDIQGHPLAQAKLDDWFQHASSFITTHSSNGSQSVDTWMLLEWYGLASSGTHEDRFDV